MELIRLYIKEYFHFFRHDCKNGIKTDKEGPYHLIMIGNPFPLGTIGLSSLKPEDACPDCGFALPVFYENKEQADKALKEISAKNLTKEDVKGFRLFNGD